MIASREDSRGRRFLHPEADVVWAAIEVLSEPLKHEVLRELATALAMASTSPRTPLQKVRKGIAALHQVFDLLGHSPSVKEYRQVCELLPELGLPPESNLRAWLGGGWNECLTRALLPAVSDGDFSEVPTAGAYTESALHAAVRDCAEALGRRPFFSEYLTWARKWNDSGVSPRRPLSTKPFERFGGYLAVLVAAGVIDRDQAHRDAIQRVIPATHEYTDSECADAIHEVRRHLGLDRAPRVTEYTRGRRELQAEFAAKGVLRALPTVQTITKGTTWDQALVKAGFEPLGGRTTASNKRGRRKSFDDETCQRALRQAWTAVGDPFTADAYTAWRATETERILAADGSPHLPSSITIGQRFGGWQRACLAAIPGYKIDPKRIRPWTGRTTKRTEGEHRDADQ